jgi:hypothetical protein
MARVYRDDRPPEMAAADVRMNTAVNKYLFGATFCFFNSTKDPT